MNKSEFQKVIKATNIREVFMISTNCKCYAPYALVKPKDTMLHVKQKEINTDFIVHKKEKKGIIISTVDFTIEGISQKDIKIDGKEVIKKGAPSFTMSTSYVVTYDVNDISLDKKAVKDFGIGNAYFNAYPYLREFMNHISQRFNLQPLVLPLLKPNKQPVESNKKRTNKSTAGTGKNKSS